VRHRTLSGVAIVIGGYPKLPLRLLSKLDFSLPQPISVGAFFQAVHRSNCTKA
jgi:hypothetical protein